MGKVLNRLESKHDIDQIDNDVHFMILYYVYIKFDQIQTFFKEYLAWFLHPSHLPPERTYLPHPTYNPYIHCHAFPAARRYWAHTHNIHVLKSKPLLSARSFHTGLPGPQVPYPLHLTHSLNMPCHAFLCARPLWVCGFDISFLGSKHLHLPDLEFLILHHSQPPKPRHPKGPPHLSCRFGPSHTDIQCIALNIRFQGRKPLPCPILSSLSGTLTTITAMSPQISPASPPEVSTNPHQYRVWCTQYSVLEVKTPPLPDLEFPTSHPHNIFLTQNTPSASPILDFNRWVIMILWGRHRWFQVEVPHPHSIPSSWHPRTQTTISPSSSTLPLRLPSLVLMGGR